MNAGEIYADIKDAPGADCIGHSTVRKYLKEKRFSKSMLDTDFEPKIEGKISLMKKFLRLVRNTSFLTPPDCQRNTDSNEHGSISFGQFFAVSNQGHLMGSPLALIEPKTSTC
jgi:hypothetical protein